MKTPTICLNMIVKNEAHIIKELFDSVYKYIDYYVIVDTGSTDKTIDVIKEYFKEKDINGEVIEHNFKTCTCHGKKYKQYSWFHFGWNRSYAIKCCSGKADYIMVMDADDVIKGDIILFNDCDIDCYNGKIKSGGDYGTEYIRPVIFKNSSKLNWQYQCGIHEFLYCDLTYTTDTLKGEYYIDSRRLGDRSKDDKKYLRDAEICETLITDEPQYISRYTFYCAQSYYDAKLYEKAIEMYNKRIELGDWEEEIYYSYYKIGSCKIELKKSENEIIEAFQTCYNKYPYRAEPLFQIIEYYRNNSKYDKVWKYYDDVIKITIPNVSLFITKSIYEWRLYDSCAICIYYCDKYKESFDLWMKVLKEKKYPSYEYERLKMNAEFAYDKLKLNHISIMHKENNKPYLCFYLGYTFNFTASYNAEYESELALKSLAEILTYHYNVYIFSMTINVERTINNVMYLHSNKLMEFQQKNTVDILIISRYVNFFLEHKSLAKKTYLWFHDILAQPYWDGKALPVVGKYLVENIFPNINGIVALTKWHKQYILLYYNIDPNKIYIIGNAITLSNFTNLNYNERVKNRFIYTSNPGRGLKELVNHFHIIKQHLLDAELYIYREINEFDNDPALLQEINKYNYIHLEDKKESIKEIVKADFWYYPTNWYETYCISALEMQMAGVICITSNLAALPDIIENRGYLIKNTIYSNEYYEEALRYILEISNNTTLKEEMRKKSIEWAKLQSWENRMKEWMNLFNNVSYETKM